MRLCVVSLLALAFLALANPVPEDEDTFERLARDADDSALHVALHANKEYKHGIFPHDRRALEAIHQAHQEEAMRIVKYAALMRRADNSSTISIPTSSFTSTNLASSSSAGSSSESSAQTASPITESSSMTSKSGPKIKPTSYITTSISTYTDQFGHKKTLYKTAVVIVTPTPTSTSPESTGTPIGGNSNPGLQTAEAGRLELGWKHAGMVVMAGVGGWVLEL